MGSVMPSPAVILVVEDNPINLKLARVLLTEEGHEVHTAVDAEEALRKLKTLRPQLILTDIQLPGMDGLELTSLLRADPTWNATVIIALTAYAMKGDEDKALSAGCDGYITKPLDPDSFPAQVVAALHRPASAAPAMVKSP
jgi:two-component system cell cycle response regulator DivK